jgi:hypothetical protein
MWGAGINPSPSFLKRKFYDKEILNWFKAG